MKVAIVTASGVNPGSLKQVKPCFLWLIERLTRHGDDVHVFCLSRGPALGPWTLLGATVHNAGGHRHGFRLFSQIVAEHRRASFDVVHTLWSPRANLVAIAAAKFLGVPALLYFGGGELAGIPEIGYGRQLKWSARLALRLAAAGADRIGAQSGYVVEQARNRGLSAERLALGVALDRWPPVAVRRRDFRRPARLIHVGPVYPIKNHNMLLEAAAQLRRMGCDFRIDLFGHDSTGEAYVPRRAAELGISGQTHFHGFVVQQVMRKYFEQADLHIVTSWHEAGPLAVYEAAVAGIPTVGTNVGYLTEMAPHAARVVAPGDSRGLAAAIADVLGNEDERQRLARRAQERAMDENADVTTRRFRQKYLDMLACSKREKQRQPVSG